MGPAAVGEVMGEMGEVVAVNRYEVEAKIEL